MRPSGEALGVGVGKHNCERERRQDQRQVVQLRRSEDENGTGDDDESGDKSRSERSGGQGASASARVGGVDGGVGDTVKGHGGGARGYHGDDDPDELMRGGQAMGGEHGSGKGEGEREDGVLPLDHLERGAQVAEERHWISLTEVWGAGLRVWGISEWSGCGVAARAKADSSWLKPFGMTRLIEWVRGTRFAV